MPPPNSLDNNRQSVCINCKLRKRKCDKSLPQCGHCTRKRLECRYVPRGSEEPLARGRPSLTGPIAHNPAIRSSLLLSNIFSDMLLLEPTNIESAVYLQIYRIIRATGGTFDEINNRYFRGIHTFVPIISPDRFNDKLDKLQGAAPPTDLSVLLLSMCLVTYHPEFSHSQNTEPPHLSTLYLTTKSLFAQVQASSSLSLPLIQAGVLIAVYEYSSGRYSESIASIGYCARMGISHGLHLVNPPGITDDELFTQVEEWNTWWSIFICERTFICEARELLQPLIAQAPEIEANRATKLEDFPLSDLSESKRIPNLPDDPSQERGAFASVARAAWLLDRTLQSLRIADDDLRIAQLKKLDSLLQNLLAVGLRRAGGFRGLWCTGNAVMMRTLFVIHRHILYQDSTPTACNSPTEMERQNSYTALNTVSMMMLDIAAAQNKLSLSLIDTLPPSVSYIIHAALDHVKAMNLLGEERIHVENQLSWTLGMLQKRWYDTA
ncbi:hypothetical protein BDV27DRAFT_133875 [Aspergillus caelatus]|uniref:Zn(2)-C6 fungal-type domain-containing protein n=1 Tax=Aspergillus caelatus TaxID=61420 RepID=A0A5N6ZV99_9EURO|nr:uncharacterized protein BDV27DRAFT_133875 [Aspergillus caelatus]KAE8360849.1 hypothetical protein BDV27DRAFT_133875 [Aspergillus caelatus]